MKSEHTRNHTGDYTKTTLQTTGTRYMAPNEEVPSRPLISRLNPRTAALVQRVDQNLSFIKQPLDQSHSKPLLPSRTQQIPWQTVYPKTTTPVLEAELVTGSQVTPSEIPQGQSEPNLSMEQVAEYFFHMQKHYQSRNWWMVGTAIIGTLLLVTAITLSFPGLFRPTSIDLRNNNPKVPATKTSMSSKPPLSFKTVPVGAKIGKGFYISSTYGDRILNGKTDFHGGFDAPAPVGTAIHAIGAPGTFATIICKTSVNGGGYFSQMTTTDPRYAHLTIQTLHQTRGSCHEGTFPAGTVVALSGNTGFSTGPHVHLTMMKEGRRLIYPSLDAFREIFGVSAS